MKEVTKLWTLRLRRKRGELRRAEVLLLFAKSRQYHEFCKLCLEVIFQLSATLNTTTALQCLVCLRGKHKLQSLV